MSSILDNPSIRQSVVPISVEQYHLLGEAGRIDQNSELLRGVIVAKMIKSPQHSWLVATLERWLRSNSLDGYHVRQEQPLTLLDSEPELDLALVAGNRMKYRPAHPTTAKLVIEVAVSSLEKDRAKASMYAEAGVEEYVIVNVDDSRVEISFTPTTTCFLQTKILGRDSVLTLESMPGFELDLGLLFGEP